MKKSISLLGTTLLAVSMTAQANNPYGIYKRVAESEKNLNDQLKYPNKPFLTESEINIFKNLVVSETTKSGPDISFDNYFLNMYDIVTPDEYNPKYKSREYGKWVIIHGIVGKKIDAKNNIYALKDKYSNASIPINIGNKTFYNEHVPQNGEPVLLFCKEMPLQDDLIMMTKCSGMNRLKADAALNMISQVEKYNTFKSQAAWFYAMSDARNSGEKIYTYNPAIYIFNAKNLSLNGFECKDRCVREVSTAYKKIKQEGNYSKVFNYLMNGINIPENQP